MQANIAIVIVAYNRPSSFSRLLKSLKEADFTSYKDICLIISIDHSGDENCLNLAKEFEWFHGSKKIIAHEVPMGLKSHMLSCGDLSNDFDAIIVLEDDLTLSPVFYDYAQKAYNFYKNDLDVAGIALFSPLFNEVALCPFKPIDDGYDTFFMQVPCSWGQIWTKEQWSKFRRYLKTRLSECQHDSLPENVQQWPDDTSWKKLFYRYMIESGLYFVYPRIGLSTNFGEIGQHIKSQQLVFQTPLLLKSKSFRFSTLNDSLSIYDSYYELEGCVYNKWHQTHMSISFDLNGTKPLNKITTEYLISSKRCNASSAVFSVACYPYELNILFSMNPSEDANTFFALGKTNAFSNELQFHRLNIDVKRFFMDDNFVRNAAMYELKKLTEYKIGESIIKPIRYIKFIAQKLFCWICYRLLFSERIKRS